MVIQIVSIQEQISDLDDISLDEIIGKLKAFEERIKLRKGGQVESQENLLFAHGEHSGKGRRFSKRRGIDCRVTSTTQEQSNLILEDDEPSLLMTTHEEVLLNEGQIQPGKYASGDASIWYLDNGASNHMTGVKSHFRDINESVTGRNEDPINDPEPPPNTPSPYTYNLHSEEEATTSSTKNSGNIFDHVPVRGFKDLTEIYQNTQEVEAEIKLFTEEEEPRNYKEASTDKKWIEAMEIELDSINKINNMTLTTLPPDQKAIGLKWVFKTKRDAEGKIIKYKARLVAKGYVQEQGIDFDEVFAPVARIETEFG
ncbi:ribonuclease H-like domain, reverse transcriptase, RNA-dependent DNA polymerase [Tanacetum coccineum]|uniref:Ribonuclease H-like domain, reverse transcriptase, RNA-dependent DNA polymerase n=1 Tax=Tanacetum coccineum TaxID=301880 RepID=A0ABQ4Z644_9ASTR